MSTTAYDRRPTPTDVARAEILERMQAALQEERTARHQARLARATYDGLRIELAELSTPDVAA